MTGTGHYKLYGNLIVIFGESYSENAHVSAQDADETWEERRLSQLEMLGYQPGVPVLRNGQI